MSDENISKEEKIEAAETLSDVAGVVGAVDVAEGLEDLEAAGEIEDVSKAALAAGASDMTRGVDEMVVADRAAVLSGVVATSGAADLASVTGKKVYTGEKIALDFYETDIKNVFRIIREISGKNFAVDKNVTGQVTLSLDKPVPWDQVLDLILKMNGLGMVLEGDIIRTIRDNAAHIGHYHTGGVPGRHELDDTQELNWPAICRAIVDTGFSGYLAHEFVPAGPDPLASLRDAVVRCDV